MSLPVSPFANPSRQAYIATRMNWLGRYLGIEKQADQRVFDALLQAMEDIDTSLLNVTGNSAQSIATRQLQLALAHKEIRATMASLFGNVENIIRDHQSQAAVAAVDALLHDEKDILSRLFPAKLARDTYAKSLRQTASRNIQAVMARTLETKQPLSKRVWKTRALSQGMVDRAINAALARGDSFQDLAESVKSLINPRVPGGVTYAAKRLSRTEINNAFHAQSIHTAAEQPWVKEMRWNLSKVHVTDNGDPCEDYARQGLFAIEQVPNKPHPHCRCFVTPEVPDYQTFEDGLVMGQYDQYLDNFISGGTPGTTSVAMKPVPKVAKTTKAGQPDGWTGPLIAKPAANKTVRDIEDRLWDKYSDIDRFLQIAREGSRTLQTKGYRGGLSSPGKQRFLAQSEMLIIDRNMTFDLGRELSARIAYAEPNHGILYKVFNMTSTDVKRLKDNPAVSFPLSRFSGNLGDAIDEAGRLVPKGQTQVVFRVKQLRAAEAGKQWVSMGHMKVVAIDSSSDGSYFVVNLLPIDVREYEAPLDKAIRNISFVKEDTLPSGLGSGGARKGIDAAITNLKRLQDSYATGIQITEAKEALAQELYYGTPTEIAKPLATKELNMLKEYRSMSWTVNDSLRKAEFSPSPEVKILDRVLERSVTTKPITVRRWVGQSAGASGVNVDVAKIEAQLAKGTFVDKGFMSTEYASHGYSVGQFKRLWADTPDSKGFVLQMDLPENFKAIDLRLETLKDGHLNEILLPRGIKWNVTSTLNVDGIKVYTLSPADLGKVKAKKAVETLEEFAERINKEDSVAKVYASLADKFPDMTFEGWRESNIDLRSAKELAITLNDLTTQFPHNGLQAVDISPYVGRAYAETSSSLLNGHSTIRMNSEWVSNWTQLMDSKRVGRLTHWNVGQDHTFEMQPVRRIFTHEFGHSLDYYAWNVKSDRIRSALEKIKKNTSITLDGWLKGKADSVCVSGLHHTRYTGAAPSGYSVDEIESLEYPWNRAEIVAEAFTDVVTHGDNARTTSKAIYKLLMEALEEAIPIHKRIGTP